MLRCHCRSPPWVVLRVVRWLSRIAPPSPATAEPVIRVSNNVARLGKPKEGPKPRQLLSLPPFPSTGTDPLPGRKKDPAAGGQPRRVTAISWVKHYFADIPPEVIQSHFNNGLVSGAYAIARFSGPILSFNLHTSHLDLVVYMEVFYMYIG